MSQRYFLCLFFFFTSIHCMDVPMLQHDVFSQQPNTIRRIFIFPLLKESHTFAQARRILLSIALVSKKSYKQMKCPVFLRNVIGVIGERFAESDIDSMKILNITYMQNYAQMNKKMMELTDIRKFPHAPLKCFSYLINRGAYSNCTFSEYNVTLLMRAVYINRFDLVKFLTQRGADITACIHHKKDEQKRNFYYVRDCNMIYYPHKVYACVRAKETEKLRTALYIDKFLETKNAPSIITIANNYLADALAEEIEKQHEQGYGRALSTLYNNDKNMIKKYVPHTIAQALYQFIDFKNSKK